MPNRPPDNRALIGPKQPPRPRLNSCQRGYDRKWQKFRLYFLGKYPLCAECEKDGQIVGANEVDHIHGHDGQEDPKFWLESNLMSLCRHHHSQKTARERKRS